MEMLVKGRSNKEIGSALRIEERTVKAYVAKLMQSRSAEPYRAFGTRRDPFAGFPAKARLKAKAILKDVHA